MNILSALFKLHLRLIYFFLKMQPKKNKICFLSWQADMPSVDFFMLEKAVKKNNPEVETLFLTKRLKKGFFHLIKYYFHMYRQMHHLATSSIAILDSYIPLVSILNHKDDLYVIQLWHALGAIKKFGFQTVGKPGGRSLKQAKYFDMHKGYSAIISTSEKTSKIFSEAFGYPEAFMKICGLPRIDYLVNEKETLKKKILDKYPELDGGKKNILYAPTFRNNGKYGINQLITAVDFDKYNLIIKPHKRQNSAEQLGQLKYAEENATQNNFADKAGRVVRPKDFLSMELLAVADFLITDYSAIALEAAVLDVPTFYYLYDYEEYKEENGFNIDIAVEMPDMVFYNADDYEQALGRTNTYLRNNYLPDTLGDSTDKIVELIAKNL